MILLVIVILISEQKIYLGKVVKKISTKRGEDINIYYASSLTERIKKLVSYFPL